MPRVRATDFELLYNSSLQKKQRFAIVRAIVRILQLFGLDHFVLKTKLLNHAIDLCALIFRQTG